MTISLRRIVDYEGVTVVLTRVSAALPGHLGLRLSAWFLIPFLMTYRGGQELTPAKPLR